MAFHQGHIEQLQRRQYLFACADTNQATVERVMAPAQLRQVHSFSHPSTHRVYLRSIDLPDLLSAGRQSKLRCQVSSREDHEARYPLATHISDSTHMHRQINSWRFGLRISFKTAPSSARLNLLVATCRPIIDTQMLKFRSLGTHILRNRIQGGLKAGLFFHFTHPDQKEKSESNVFVMASAQAFGRHLSVFGHSSSGQPFHL